MLSRAKWYFKISKINQRVQRQSVSKSASPIRVVFLGDCFLSKGSKNSDILYTSPYLKSATVLI